MRQQPNGTSVFAKAGLAAKGTVYCLVGILACMAAFHIGGHSTDDADKSGIFTFVKGLPFGGILLFIIAAGLICYCIWRFIEVFSGNPGNGDRIKSFAKRARYLFSAVVYGAFSFAAVKSLISSETKNGDSNKNFAENILHQPFGIWLLAAAALVLAGIGIYQLNYGLREKYRKHAGNAVADPEAKHLLVAGKIGYVSRGIVWLIIGWMFMKAAVKRNATEAGDTSEAFDLISSSYSPYVLAIIAIGLFCYGVFCFIRAIWDRF